MSSDPRGARPLRNSADRLSGGTPPASNRSIRRGIRNSGRVLAEWFRPRVRVMLSAYLAAFLLGLSAAWQWCGIRTILSAAIDPLPATSIMVGAVALLAAALGPWLPERAVLRVAEFIRRRSRRMDRPGADGTGTFWMLRAVRERDESLMWLSLSVLATAGGGASLLVLALSGPAVRLYDHLLRQFFWTRLTLTGLEWCGVALLIGLPWVIYGLLLATLAPTAGASGGARRQPPGLPASVVLGLGLAFISYEALASHGFSGGQVFMAGVLPMFLLAGMAAWLAQRTDRVRRESTKIDDATPELTRGAEGLVWFSLVVWGVSSALVGTGWLSCRFSIAPPWPPVGIRPGWYLVTLGVGMIAARLHSGRRVRSASGCGMAAWAAGVGAGAGATLTAYQGDGWVADTIQLLVLGIPFGYALHYAERAWLARVGSETLGFAQLASAILAGLAAGLIGGYFWALPLLGSIGMMTAGALLMLALGGLVQIYDQDRPHHVQRYRLAAIFASLAAAIVLFPMDARQWSGRQQGKPKPADRTADLEWLSNDELPGDRRVCLINVDPDLAVRWPGLGNARVDILPLYPVLPAPEPPKPPAGRTRILKDGVFRTFRLERTRYDLVYQRGLAWRPLRRFGEYSAEWLRTLAGRTLPGGQVIVDVPLAGMTRQAIAVIAATFEYTMPTSTSWTLVHTQDGPVLRLRAGPPEKVSDNKNVPANGSQTSRLFATQSGLKPHSIRRDAITAALQPQFTDTSPPLIDWLNQCRSAQSILRSD